jgi:glycosyltransferase involved in cell wall biosynthesis
MKLIIQIPCLNEEDYLGQTIDDLPKKIDGIDKIEILIINDGSTDNSLKVAKNKKVNHIVSHSNQKGLAYAFSTGINKCLELGADIIVNTDADNQYQGRYIKDLVSPIIKNESDIIIGVRDTDAIEDFSAIKKYLQKIGSGVVRYLSGTSVSDTTSGFRAFSKDAAMRLNRYNSYTYTLDTIIQAGHKNISISTTPIKTNPDLRPSRLVKSNFSYVIRNAIGIVRIFLIYRSFQTIFYTGLILFSAGFLLGLRYIYLMSMDDGAGNVQSLILSAILLTSGFISFLSAILADKISTVRQILEEKTYKINKILFKK